MFKRIILLVSGIIVTLGVLFSSCGSSIKKVGDQYSFDTFLGLKNIPVDQLGAKLTELGLEFDGTDFYEKGDVSVALNDLQYQPSVIKVSSIYKDVAQKWETELKQAGYVLDQTTSPDGDFTWTKLYVKKADGNNEVVTISALEDSDDSESGVYMYKIFI